MAVIGAVQYRLRLFFSCLGVIIGVSAFITFGFNLRNWNAASWGLTSAFPALITLLVHIGNKKGRYENCPERLRAIMLLGCFFQLAGVCGFVTYLTLALTSEQGLIVHGNGFYLTCVWCFMVWKWGFLLFYFSRKYWRKHQSTYSGLQEDTVNEVKGYGSSE